MSAARRHASPDTADDHDLIRVHGARVNNLKDVSVEIPKRRLTVFTGVSGSGKSSLVFGTIAAESQRLINETYSAFVQGFMPTLARPDVDVLDGLTTAIIVDQERIGADARSTVGTATDANAMLRILFSRLGQPHIGSPQRVLLQRRRRSAAPARSRCERGAGKTVKDAASASPAACARAAKGAGTVTDFDLTAAVRRQQVARPRARSPSPATAWTAGTAASSASSGFLDPDKPISKYTKKELHDFLYKEPTRMKVDGHQPDLRGADPENPEVDAVQGHRRAAAAHPGVRGAGGHLHDLPGLRRHPAQRGGPVLEDQGDQHRRRLRDADQRPGRMGPRPRRAVGGAAARRAAADPRLVRRRSGWATSRSTGRRARCRAARRSASR